MKVTKKSSLLKQGKKYLSSLFWLIPCGGGICLRERQGHTEILCIMHKKGKLMLPKGHTKGGESSAEAALREFREETGLRGSILGEKIGILRDRYRGKKITFYMIHQTQDHTVYPHDEATLWIDIEDALEKMKHATERKFLKRHFL